MPVILLVNKCPNCASTKRKELYRPIRDTIESIIVKCDNCNLVYNGIRLREAKKDTIMKKVFLSPHKESRKRIPYWTAYMKQLKKSARGAAHLDVGSGTGLLLEGGLKAGFKSKGVEPFAPSAKIARDNGLIVVGTSLS
ncbi:MAG: hypothetical protein GOV15_00300, partial [Candidatus Diapherotrites archaeon]|nr:hypothetical protein [Candidatus Diapherotrites archaeon]